MKKDPGNTALDNPGNIVLRVLSMIGAAFLVVAGGYIHTARAADNNGERTHRTAQERSHYGPTGERHRTGERSERERISAADSRHTGGTAGEREHIGAGSRHRVR